MVIASGVKSLPNSYFFRGEVLLVVTCESSPRSSTWSLACSLPRPSGNGFVPEDDVVETGKPFHHFNRKNMPLLGVLLVHGLCHLNLIWMEPQIWFHDHLTRRSFCPRRPRRCESRGFLFTSFRTWSIFWGVRKCWDDLWRIFSINPQSSYRSIHSLIAPTFLTPWSNKCIG